MNLYLLNGQCIQCSRIWFGLGGKVLHFRTAEGNGSVLVSFVEYIVEGQTEDNERSAE